MSWARSSPDTPRPRPDFGRATALSRWTGATRRRSTTFATSWRCGPTRRVAIEVERGDSVSRTSGHAQIGHRSRTSSGRPQRKGLLGVAPTTTVLERLPLIKAVPEGGRLYRSADRARSSTGSARSSLARFRPRRLAGQSRSPRSPGRARRSGRCRSSSCSPSSQLISDSSTSCQSRCWMEAICFSMPSRQSGAARSAPRRSNGRSAAGLAVILALVLFTTFNDLGSIGLWDRLQRLIG